MLSETKSDESSISWYTLPSDSEAWNEVTRRLREFFDSVSSVDVYSEQRRLFSELLQQKGFHEIGLQRIKEIVCVLPLDSVRVTRNGNQEYLQFLATGSSSDSSKASVSTVSDNESLTEGYDMIPSLQQEVASANSSVSTSTNERGSNASSSSAKVIAEQAKEIDRLKMILVRKENQIGTLMEQNRVLMEQNHANCNSITELQEQIQQVTHERDSARERIQFLEVESRELRDRVEQSEREQNNLRDRAEQSERALNTVMRELEEIRTEQERERSRVDDLQEWGEVRRERQRERQRERPRMDGQQEQHKGKGNLLGVGILFVVGAFACLYFGKDVASYVEKKMKKK